MISRLTTPTRATPRRPARQIALACGVGALLAIGVVGCLFWPAALNVAMVLGLAPVIGVPLPLFSYGGSALVTTLALTGLLMNVSMRRYVF